MLILGLYIKNAVPSRSSYPVGRNVGSYYLRRSRSTYFVNHKSIVFIEKCLDLAIEVVLKHQAFYIIFMFIKNKKVRESTSFYKRCSILSIL